MKTFYHGGDFGDILYSLPFVASEGGGRLLIGPDACARVLFDAATVEVIAPLIRRQGYITAVEFTPAKPSDAVDLTHIRDHWTELKRRRLNLVQSYFHVFGKPSSWVYSPWLDVPESPCAFQTIVHRSPRWHDPHFPWGHVMHTLYPSIVFVGLPDEHEDFVRRFGPVPHVPTGNFLEMASVIKSCGLFIGNQSAPMAVALGLGVRTCTEYWPEWPNIFVR